MNKKFNKNLNKIEPWCTYGILISRKEKFRLGSVAARFPSPTNINCFKTYRNLYNQIIRAARKSFFEKEFVAHQSDAKKTWNLIRLALRKKPKKKL